MCSTIFTKNSLAFFIHFCMPIIIQILLNKTQLIPLLIITHLCHIFCCCLLQQKFPSFLYAIILSDNNGNKYSKMQEVLLQNI